MEPAARPTIYVDSRERPSGLGELLQESSQVILHERWLPYGDILIADLLIERKTTADLVASLNDGRLFRQMSGLLAFSTRRLLIVEGLGYPLDRGVSLSGIEGALVKIECGMQIPVVSSANLEETSKLILRIVAQEQRAISRGVSRASKPRRKDTCPQSRALRAIPSIAPKARTHLLEKFRTLQNLFSASCEELTKVEGVSLEMARDVLKLGTEPAHVTEHEEALPESRGVTRFAICR